MRKIDFSLVKKTGYYRAQDRLGRITVPKHFVKSNRYNMFMENKKMIVEMVEDGISRFDELNRMTIPVEVRKVFLSEPGTYFEIERLDEYTLVISPKTKEKSLLEIRNKMTQLDPSKDWGKWLRGE